MQKIIPLVKAESLIPLGAHCYELLPAIPPTTMPGKKPCPFLSLALAQGAERDRAYCRYIKSEVRHGTQHHKPCGIRLTSEAPPSPTAYAKVFVVAA